MPTYSEYRARARGSLRGNWTGAVVATLLLYVVFGIIGALNSIPVLGWIIDLLITGPIMLGLYAYYVDLVRTGRTDISTLFSGFSQFVNAFVLYILMAIFTFLWALLLFIPGIIAAIRYSQAYFILRDNPSIGPLEAINRSKRLMAGNKGRYFVLILTFIGWAILASIPFGLGYLWLAPYITTTAVHFYEDLRTRSASFAAPPPPPPPPSEPTKYV